MGQAVDPVIPCRGTTNKSFSFLSCRGNFRPEELTRLTGAGAKADAEARQIAAMAPESFMVVKVCMQAVSYREAVVRHRRSGVATSKKSGGTRHCLNDVISNTSKKGDSLDRRGILF